MKEVHGNWLFVRVIYETDRKDKSIRKVHLVPQNLIVLQLTIKQKIWRAFDDDRSRSQ